MKTFLLLTFNDNEALNDKPTSSNSRKTIIFEHPAMIKLFALQFLLVSLVTKNKKKKYVDSCIHPKCKRFNFFLITVVFILLPKPT